MITDDEQIQTYYKALVNRDSSFVGSFVVGVKTTSICCIATCSARKPKFENVEFYNTLKEALHAGYRPCKVCKPTQNAFETPEMVQKALDLLKAKPKDKLKDWQLRENNISPEVLRRWFKKNYGITFQAYQRMLRINTAFEELKRGKKVLPVAFDNGYESLSGFAYTFGKYIGQAPSKKESTSPILINRFTTPIGPMFICATDQGICLLEFVDRRMLETEFKDLQKHLKATILAGENELMKEAKKQLLEYFGGKRRNFDLALHTPGTDFQNRVWQALQKIPLGTTASYQEQAKNIGNEKAVRAVASANGYNRIAIVIPCHRVIGKDGSLIGYGGGLQRKKWLLDHEKNMTIG